MAARFPAGLAVTLLVSAALAGCSGQASVTATPRSPDGTGSPGNSASTLPAPSASSVAPSSGAATSAPTPTLPASGTWARLEVDGPAPAAREDHTWTVGEDGRTVYLFGGRDGGSAFDDLWTFDLATDTWRRRIVGGDLPEKRFGHEGIWVPGSGLAIWAGQAGSTFYDDLWLFDPALGSWELLPADGQAPVARYGSCSGIGPDGRLWISHGFTEDGTRFADTRAYDFTARTWIDQTPPGDGPFERCLQVCWWTSDGRFALYGGQTTGVPALGDLWFMTPGSFGAATNAWAEAPAPEPPARHLPAVARSETLTVLMGGRGLDGKALADTWLLGDGSTSFAPLDTNGAPPARSGAAMVYDAARDRFVLFGGIGRDASDEVWELTFP